MASPSEPDLHLIYTYTAGCDLLNFLVGNSLPRPLIQKIAACGSFGGNSVRIG
jgi:hypothetical protein